MLYNANNELFAHAEKIIINFSAHIEFWKIYSSHLNDADLMENFLNVHKGEQNMHKILLSHSLLYYINEKEKITYRNPSQIIKKPRNKNKQTNKRNTNCTRVEILDWYLRLVLCVISKIQGFWLKNYR